MERIEESRVLYVNDRRTIFVDYRYDGKVRVDISEKALSGEEFGGLCGVHIDVDGSISYTGNHYHCVGLLDRLNNRIIPWDVERPKQPREEKGCEERRKTFQEIVTSGEWNQGRYEYFAGKYALQLCDPVREQLEKVMPRGNALEVSLIQMTTRDIIREFLMELYSDKSQVLDGEKTIMECREIILEETRKLDKIAHGKRVPEELHAGIEQVSTRLLDVLGTLRGALGIKDWTELDSRYPKNEEKKQP